MNPFAQIVSSIIKEQQSIIGPMAVEQARKVEGLQIKTLDEIVIVGNGKVVLGNLVTQFSKFFGQASIEVCKDAFEPYAASIPQSEIPDILK